nr:immunoglobulin heavy chain junction region [Macaca mulatta]MOY26765.1 immunoglobulin heavy chain junction region [Macaca mulatta]MOY27763.1 immunoglobulin heavy chain junction region [Macaca mulatta]
CAKEGGSIAYGTNRFDVW